MKKLILTLAFLQVMTIQAFQLSPEEKLSDLNQLITAIKSGYGPYQYKQKVLGLNMDELKEKYTKLINQTKNNSEFYYLIVKFVAEFHDGHFYASIPTDHSAKAGFSVNWINGKVYVAKIDREILPKEKFPFEKGDEVVAVDEMATPDFLQDKAQYTGNGFRQTELALAAYKMTSRRGSSIPVPKGSVVYKIRKGTSNIIEEVTLEWIYKGTPLDENLEFKNTSFVRSPLESLNNLSIKDRLNDLIDPGFHCSGKTRVAMPKDATVIMKEPFLAYYHPSEKGNIGYLRIPHYSPKNSISGENEFELRFAQYQYAVSKLEKNTVGLIIDQDHNCGGSVSYLHQILSLFIEKPVKPMQFQLMANKREYLGYKNWIDSNNPFTTSYEQVKTVTELILEAWKKGDFLTDFTSIGGTESIFPNNIRYTKPILILIDFWSGSGGDAFPSMMQGYGRAKLFGTRTMGLGGHVGKLAPLNYSGIKVNYTKSLFYRPDGVAVENNGAVPDIPYTITRDDFMYEFKNYQKAYLKTLSEML
jgi:hypothetical protein